jgi:LRP1 type putative zinc finger protein
MLRILSLPHLQYHSKEEEEEEEEPLISITLLISLQLIPLKQVCICLSSLISTSLSLSPLCHELGFRGLELWFVNALTVCTSIVTKSPPVSSSKGGLPPEVRAQALFKCVRLMGVEDSENEFAYQATVKIGGHIFKGVLYDQGVDNGQAAAAAPSPSALGELQLGGGNSRGGGMPSSSSALIDPSSSLYGSGSALLGGQTSFTHNNNLQHSY